MATIHFKATRKKHNSGYAIIDKSGDLQFDQDKLSKDGIWLYPKIGSRIFIDCDYETKEFMIHFNERDFSKRTN
jgi:hypothetical protein